MKGKDSVSPDFNSLVEQYNKLHRTAQKATSSGNAGIISVEAMDIVQRPAVKMETVTREQLEQWLGGDDLLDKCLGLLVELANGSRCQVGFNREVRSLK